MTAKKSGWSRPAPRHVPTESIKFGEIDESACEAQERLRRAARTRHGGRQSLGSVDTSVGGTHAFFIVRGDPRSYNLPPKPEVPTIYLKKAWTSSAVAAGLLLAGSLFAFLPEGSARR